MKLKTKAKWTGVVLTAPYLAGFFLLFVLPFSHQCHLHLYQRRGSHGVCGAGQLRGCAGKRRLPPGFLQYLPVPPFRGAASDGRIPVAGLYGQRQGEGKTGVPKHFSLSHGAAGGLRGDVFSGVSGREGILNSLLTQYWSPFCWIAGFGNLLRGADLPYIWRTAATTWSCFWQGSMPSRRNIRNRPAGRGRAGPDFRKITLPLLEPSTVFVLVISIMNGLRASGGVSAGGDHAPPEYLYAAAFHE